MARVVSYSQAVAKHIDALEQRFVTQGAAILQSTIVRGITDSVPRGRFYARGQRRAKRGSSAGARQFPRASAIHARFAAVAATQFHRASAPGQYPAVDTGTFRASITTDVSRVGTRWEGRVGTADTRGRMLEFGTARMRPRPWLRPSLQKALPQLRAMKLQVA